MRDLGSHGPYCITESHANPPNMPHSRLYGSAVDLEFFNFSPEFFLTKVAGFCSGLATVGAGGGLAGVRGCGRVFRALLLHIYVHFKPAQDRKKHVITRRGPKIAPMDLGFSSPAPPGGGC